MIRRTEFYTLIAMSKDETLHAESGVVLPMAIDEAETYVRANYYGFDAFSPETDTPRQQGQAGNTISVEEEYGLRL